MTEMTKTNRPTHRAYYVTGEGDERRWHELGPLWAHKDGSGFTFVPSVLPAAGQAIVIRTIKAEGEEARIAHRARHGECIHLTYYGAQVPV